MSTDDTAFGLKGILAEFVDPAQQRIEVTLPVVPEVTTYDYVLKAVRAE